MPTQKTDRNTTWTITADDETWTLAKKATIAAGPTNGIDENGHSGSAIRVLGDIRVGGMAAGVYVNGSNSSVFIGEDSTIRARQSADGIFSAAAGADIVNHGAIHGAFAGIRGAIWSDVRNYGSISGDYGILHEGAGSQIYNYGRVSAGDTGIVTDANGSYLLNARGAVIRGDDIAVQIRDTGDMELRNRGTIRSDNFAIEDENGALSVRNTGRIIGDVALGGGDDILDTRGGTVGGIVYGGGGDDTLITSRSNIKLQESAMGGAEDRVVSSASYKLGAHVEDLILIGGKDIHGTGNGGDNRISGNAGDNVLKGKGGADMITGGAGNDLLHGGADTDVFFFAKGDDVDRVRDFKDGEDLIGISGVESYADFTALNIKQTTDGVAIDLGDGDKLIIEGLLKSDFTYDDIYLA